MLAGQAKGAVHYVSKLRRISGKMWRSSMIELCMPGDFMHNSAMHELPMLEVQPDASGGALTQPDSIRERTSKDSENPKTDWWKWQSKIQRRLNAKKVKLYFERWLQSLMEVIDKNPKDMMQMELSYIHMSVGLAAATCWIKLRQLWWEPKREWLSKIQRLTQ